jgi:hypothetical protein
MASVFDQYQMMRTHHLIFGYRGTLTNDLITSLLQLSDSKLKELKTPFRKKKSIINILIECLQNILYHSESFHDGLFSGHHCLFLLGKRESDYFIQIGNFIDNTQMTDLRSKLDYLNTLDYIRHVSVIYWEKTYTRTHQNIRTHLHTGHVGCRRNRWPQRASHYQ